MIFLIKKYNKCLIRLESVISSFVQVNPSLLNVKEKILIKGKIHILDFILLMSEYVRVEDGYLKVGIFLVWFKAVRF